MVAFFPRLYNRPSMTSLKTAFDVQFDNLEENEVYTSRTARIHSVMLPTQKTAKRFVYNHNKNLRSKCTSQTHDDIFNHLISTSEILTGNSDVGVVNVSQGKHHISLTQYEAVKDTCIRLISHICLFFKKFPLFCWLTNQHTVTIQYNPFNRLFILVSNF